VSKDFSLNQFLQDKSVTQLRIDHAFTLIADDGSVVTIEADFLLKNNGEERLIQISNTEDLGYALSILHSTITNIEVKESVLYLQFRQHDSLIRELEVQPQFEYEAWNISLSNRKRYICMPSGEIAIFS
jgi:hypothetical protein